MPGGNRPRSWIGAAALALAVAVYPLTPLMPLLRLDRKRGNRPRLESPDRDRIAGFLAIAVGALFEPRQGGLDLGDQLALAIASTKLDGSIGFRRSPVREIRMVLILIVEMLERLLGFFDYVLLPGEQLRAEVLPLALIHERLFVGGSVIPDFFSQPRVSVPFIRRHCFPVQRLVFPLCKRVVI